MKKLLLIAIVSSLAQAFPVEVKTTEGRPVWVELDVLKSALLNALGRRSLEQESVDFVGKTAVITRPKIRVAGQSYRIGWFSDSDVCRLYGFGMTIEKDNETLGEQPMASVGFDGQFRRLASWDKAYLRVSCNGVF